MGLFSRKKSEQATRGTSRNVASSEAQAAELRGRARRRLIGALVLVLTAVIVVPLMFDDTPTQQTETPLVLPAVVPPVPEPDLALTAPSDLSVDEPALAAGGIQQPEATVSPQDGDVAMASETMPDGTPESMPSDTTSTSAASSKPAEAKPDPEPRPEPVRTEPKPAASATEREPSKPRDERTDDGSLALALLEGRVPPSTARSAEPATQQGSFVLQVAAYSTEADAQNRRSSLVEAGVTNAYVERAVSNNKPTYRLRVGSFPTRDAAQAAQARLRALGYDNSLLLTQ